MAGYEREAPYSEKTARKILEPRPYYADPYTTTFDTRVLDRKQDERGLWVALERSYFYPESGGQEPDRGTLSGVRVLDVQEDDAGRVWHLVEANVPEAVRGDIDAERRASNRQQHTGQHILSQAFEKVLGAETASSRLGEDVGTIDLEVADLTWEQVTHVEEAANRVIWENRTVVSHVVLADELDRFPLRKPPVVEGLFRVVEIHDWDVSACGGTHCRAAGEVGIVKVKRWQREKGGVRVEFVCGVRAWRDYGRRVQLLAEAAARRDTGEMEIVETLERAAAERDTLRKRAAKLAASLTELEARELAAVHTASGDAVLLRVFDDRPFDELRGLCLSLAAAGVPRIVLAAKSPEARVLVARPRGKSGDDLRTFLPVLLEETGGTGGGGSDLLQVAAANGKRAVSASERLAKRWAERQAER